MPDLRLVGVQDDGEHLLLADDEGQRYRLAVDEALRAAVRRDRVHLGQLQIETEGGLRPRDVQARIRAGATSEEVAVLAGWSVEKVRRYEGPVLAERAHVAELARRVRLRRRGGEPVLLGAEVATRLEDRGVAVGSIAWDSWRTEDGPWTVVVYFAAGGRERQARWHLDLASSSVTPVDDEARWLSEESAPADGPVPGLRLTAVPSPGVYDIEADGGVSSTGPRDGGSHGAESRAAGSRSAESGNAGSRTAGSRTAESRTAGSRTAESLDLVTAMRTRHREPGRGMPARTATARPLAPSSNDPASVPGARHPAHLAARRRQAQPEPLELEPTLMDDPPAAHPPASEYHDLAAEAASVADGLVADVPVPVDEAAHERVVQQSALDESPPEESVLNEVAVAQQVTVMDEVAVDSRTESDDVTVEEVAVEEVTVVRRAAVVSASQNRQPEAAAPEALGSVDSSAQPPATESTATENTATDSTVSENIAAEEAAPAPARAPQRTGRQRPGGRSRNRRSSVPSWDDIMFGAKRD